MNRTKIIAIGLVCILLVTGILATGRTINDSGDTIYRTITTSMGDSYTCTAANLQTALNKVAPPSGGTDPDIAKPTVYMPGNTSLTITSAITIPHAVILDLQGSRIYCNTNGIEVFNATKGSEIVNGRIYFGAGATTSVAIAMYGHSGASSVYTTRIKDIAIRSNTDQTNTGIKMFTRTPGTSVSLVEISGCRCYYLGNGIYINSSGGTGMTSATKTYITGIIISDTYLMCKSDLYIYRTSTVYDATQIMTSNLQVSYDYVSTDPALIWTNCNGSYIQATTWDISSPDHSLIATAKSGYNTFVIDDTNYHDYGWGNIVIQRYGYSGSAGPLPFMAFPLWKPNIYYQASTPNIPNNAVGFWVDSDDSKYYLVLDRAGTQKAVEITTAVDELPPSFHYQAQYEIYKVGNWSYVKNGINGTMMYNGSTNHRYTFYKAATYCNGAGAIYVHAGTYYWDTTTISTSVLQNVRFIGEDKQTTILKAAGGAGALYGFFNFNGVGNMSFEQFTIDGRNASGQRYYGFSLKNCNNTTISDCVLQNLRDEAIVIWGRSNNVKITRCDFFNCGMGFSSSDGILYLKDNLNNIELSSNNLRWTKNPVGTYIRVIYAYPGADGDLMKKLHIINNNIDGGTFSGIDMGIWINGGNTIRDISNSTITGNTVLADDEGFYMDYAENMTVLANVFKCNGGGTAMANASCYNCKPAILSTLNV